jgi:uncharacterized protein (DUF433 family)
MEVPMTTTTYAIEHIVSTPGVCGGRPRIAGHRIRVQDIVLAYEGTGGSWSVERIAEEYEISPAQIHAALSYYYDHREEIERALREEDALVAETQRRFPPGEEVLDRQRKHRRER